MKKLIALVLTITVVLSLGIVSSAATTTAKAKKEVKVGFIYVGPATDGGYNTAHDNGRKFLVKTLGVKTIVIENVGEDKKSVVDAVNNLKQQGVNLVFADSFGHLEGMVAAAKQNPDMIFEHCSGYLVPGDPTNLGIYFGRMEQPRYLSGIAAAMKTKTNKLGYVVAFPTPECIRQVNAFTLGAQSVNPKVTVQVVFTHTWYDPATEKEAAKSLLDKGCDVLAQHQDSPAAMQAAQAAGKYAIGFDLDTRNAAPKAFLTAPIFDWGKMYVDIVKSVMDGKWKQSDLWYGMDKGITDLAPLSSLAAPGTKAAIVKAEKKIMAVPNGEFAGPIYDQAGKLRVPKGKTLTDAQQKSTDMNWFVKGVVGDIK
jgi:basic membrane protein A